MHRFIHKPASFRRQAIKLDARSTCAPDLYQMSKNRLDLFGVLHDGNDSHIRSANRTDERINFGDLRQEPRPRLIEQSSFLERINQDRLLHWVQQRVADNWIIRLTGLTLRSGVMTETGFVPTEEGTTQGSPLSPLLSNITMDELDKQIERRGPSFWTLPEMEIEREWIWRFA